MAHYVVTGIWKNHFQGITDLFIHPVRDNNVSFDEGTRRTQAEVIQMFEAGDRFQATWWDYANMGWKQGEQIAHAGGEMRTVSGGKATTSLAHLINYQGVI